MKVETCRRIDGLIIYGLNVIMKLHADIEEKYRCEIS